MAAKSSVDGLWKYIKERENIRVLRACDEPWPWTKDKILQMYKFTNVQREYDRTSKIFKALYEGHRAVNSALLLYNCGVARYFGTAEFYARLGWQTSYDPTSIMRCARDMIEAGKPVFTRAYVITNGGLSMPKEEYVATHPLKALWHAKEEIVTAIHTHQRWQMGYEVLHKLDGFGGTGFMAKEVLMDYIQFSPSLADWFTFTPVGPGALRGLGRIYYQNPNFKFNASVAQGIIHNIWEVLRGPWQMLHPLARPLSCSDVQFCLCEYDKYERTRLREGKPKNKYVRRDK